MRGVEIARQKASALHEKLVRAGANPNDPMAIASAAAQDLGIDLEPIEPGSVLLEGGQAHFDPIERAIRYSDDGSPFDQAFRIGHEVGHACLGDDRIEHVALSPDPTRPAEASPVGEERVSDYSRQQRREIQMDIFGRELLIPRLYARQLHLDGKTAFEIAELMGIPKPVVAQQMLDALFLPQAPAFCDEELADTVSHPLNKEQREAALHRGGPYLLEAGPGTGKTQTLVGRVASLGKEGVDPRKILVLTFSNKAAGELSERIANIDSEAAAAMWIGTFHAFGLDIVRRYSEELGFPSEPRLMDRSEAIELLEREYQSFGLVHHAQLWNPTRPLKDMLGAFSRAKDEVADPVTFRDLATAMIDGADGDAARIAGERCLEVSTVFSRYEELKRDANAVDFGDLVTLPVHLLDNCPSAARHLREAYEHILVDEYQDVNRSSVQLLQKMAPEGRGLWVVGDARQSIYRFRGASTHNIAKFTTDYFPGADIGRLITNYRSSPEVVRAFSTFGSGMCVASREAGLKANRPSRGQTPKHIEFGDNDDEADALADEITSLREAHEYSAQAVLCPGNARLARMGRELERRDVPVLYLGSLFEREEVKDLLSILSLLIDKRAMALVRAPSLPICDAQLSIAGATKIIEMLSAGDAAPMAWVSTAIRKEGLNPSDEAALDQLSGILEGLSEHSDPWSVLVTILFDKTRIAATLAQSGSVSDRARGMAIWQLMGFLRTIPRRKGLPIQNALEHIRRLVLLADERDLRHLPEAAKHIDAVRLMTIHASKGLEFPVVHVMGMNRGAMPSTARTPACPVPDGMIQGSTEGTVASTKADHALEQECLFYVACSRAKDELRFYSATSDAGGRKRSPSEFLERVGPLERVWKSPSPTGAPGPELLPLAIRATAPVEVTVAQLALYERCPRRFLYTHLLRTGGRRTATTLTRLHDVIRSTVERITALDPSLLSVNEALEIFDGQWGCSEMAEEGDAVHREIGEQLVRRLVEIRKSGTIVECGKLQAKFESGTVFAQPDDVLTTEDGKRVARVIRTGHSRSSTGKDLADAAFHFAASSTDKNTLAQFVHLGDDEPITELQLGARALRARPAKVDEALAGMASGNFPPQRSEFTCPVCPAFFICGDLAPGSLEKNIQT